jgi:hypothetical protein
MVGPPLLLALEADLTVFRIGLDFPLMIILAAPPLASRLATDALLRTKSRGNKQLGTKKTKGHLDPSGLN